MSKQEHATAEQPKARDPQPAYEPPRILRKRAVVEVTLANCSQGNKWGAFRNGQC